MKNLFKAFLVLLFLFSLKSSAQSVQSQASMYMPLPFGVGFGYELGIGQQFSIGLQGEFRSYIGDDDFAADNIVMSPRIALESRYYYNMNKRFENGKNVDNNSANYFGLLISEEFPIGYSGIRNSPSYTTRILPKWGMRRTLSQNFTIDFGAYFGAKYGPTLYYVETENSVSFSSTARKQNEWKPAYGVYVTLSHIF